MHALRNVVLIARVGHVEVVGVGRKLCCQCVDLLHTRCDAEGLAQCADLSGTSLDWRDVGVSCNLAITKPSDLQIPHPLRSLLREQLSHIPAIHASVSHARDVLELAQEPLVDLRQIVDPVHSVTLLQRALDREQPRVSGRAELLVERDVVARQIRPYALEAVQRRVDHPASLLYHLLERTSDAHDLSHAKHGRSQLVRDTFKLLEIPSRHLEDAVIQRWLKARCGCLRHRVPNGYQILPQAELSGHVREGISRGLRG
mmetsp:Transcript_4619/g.11633  ORF Transcript_4619/g.11633 Transcript_4619/m.11633 type:complete len:258 (+) Transcript_4619:1841-2614(+)